MTNSIRKIPVRYDLRVEYGSFDVEDVKKEGLGGADAIMFIACSREEGDRLIPAFFSGKENKKSLCARELYDIWIDLGKKILFDAARSGEFLVAMQKMNSVSKALEDAGALEEVMAKINNLSEGEEDGSKGRDVQEGNEGKNSGNVEGVGR